jgi:hypothetical protein
MLDLDDAHRILRILHVVVGFSGLGLFWVPVFARKGSRLHIRSGRWFVWCACFVGVTGLLASIWGLAHPASFLPAGEYRSLDREEARLAAESLRFILSITGFFGLGVLSGVAIGVSIMRVESRHDRLRRPMPLILSGGFAVWSGALAIYGAGSLMAAYAGWHFIPADAAGRYWLCVALGAFGVYGSAGDLRFILNPPSSRPERLAMHIECMIGAGAAFYAAFFLFGATRLFSLPGSWLLAPVMISAVATRRLIAHYTRKPPCADARARAH